MLLFIALIGCADETKSTDSAEPQGAVDCSALSAQECDTQAECSAIVAQEMLGNGDGGFCIDWEAEMEQVGCTGSASSITVETYAASPAEPETCWYFRNGTIPMGWVTCENVTQECPSCSTLDAEECAASPTCTSIGGMMMQSTEDGDFCIDWEGEAATLGCKDTGPCEDAETYARPEDNPDVCWFFADTCIPEGWVSCSSGAECE